MNPIPSPPPPPDPGPSSGGTDPYVTFVDRIRFLHATAGIAIPRADVGEALAELDAALA